MAILLLFGWATYSPLAAAVPNLNVSVIGQGRVKSLTPATPSINCPATCAAEYPASTTVTLQATAEIGYVFSAWGGACAGSAACQVNLAQAKTVSAVFTRKDSLLVDFHQYGLWQYEWPDAWHKLHDLSADQIVAADLDGNANADVVVDFGDPYGLWAWMNNADWVRLHTLSPANITAANLDANSNTDLSVSFGKYGLWAWMNNQDWQKLHDLSPTLVTPIYLNDNLQQELLIDFAPYKLWLWTDNQQWVNLHDTATSASAAGDFDGNGLEDLAISFPPYGLWLYMNSQSWVKLHEISATSFATADVDGNGIDDLAVNFGQYGLWLRMNNQSWVKLHELSPASITAAYLDRNAQQDLVVDFNPYGLWQWMNNQSWVKLHVLSPRHVVASPELNRPPQITSQPIVSVMAGQAYRYQVVAADPEGTAVAYSLPAAPAGMTVNAQTGLIQWTAPAAGGPFVVTLTVADAKGIAASQSFQITLNRNPQITSLPVTKATEGKAYSYQPTATDADGDTLSYSLTANPTGMTINAQTGDRKSVV